MSHRVLIVGLGRIGMGYDLDTSPSEHVLSHARAFQLHPAFALVGGVDTAAARRTLFEERFASPAFDRLETAVRETQPDVVVIAAPTAEHADLVMRSLATRAVRTVLCEKPMTASLADACALVDACRQQDCALYVNYMRRADVTTADIRRRLALGLIELPVRGVVWYSKGLHNSASHFANLSQHFFGDVVDVRVLAAGVVAKGRDPEPDFRLTFERAEVDFLAARTSRYFHNTVEWIAPNGRLRYERGGAAAYWESTSADATYADYTMLDGAAERLPGDFQRVQWHVADQLAASLRHEPAQICRGDEALRTFEVLSRVEGLQ